MSWKQAILRRQNWLVLLVFFVLYVASVPSAPLTDDDDFYLPAGAAYAGWLFSAVRLEEGALTQRRVDAAFHPNHEHPPVAKYGLGLAGMLFSSLLGPIAGPRLSTVCFSFLAAFSMIWMCREAFGPKSGTWLGLYSSFLLLSLPRWFLHSRVGTLDVPVAAMYVCTAAFAFRAERSRWSSLWVGPMFGLATATKLNAPFLFFPYLAFSIIQRRFRGFSKLKAGQEVGERRSFELPRISAGLVSCAVLGPATFFLVWPWMWFDTIARVQEYINFHLKHYGIYFLYFGRIFEIDPVAPWTMPFVMVGLTVPAGLLLLAAWGLIPSNRIEGKDRGLGLWVLLHSVTTIGTVAFSGGAKYGGVKLFLPFFPFLCLAAGIGARKLLMGLHDTKAKAAMVVLAMVPISGLAQGLRTSTAPLSQYSFFAGGLRGATVAGFERQYYDLAFHDLVAYLNKEAPQNLNIHFLPNNWEYQRTFRWYRKEKRLRADIQVVSSESQADWIVITHERRFARYGGDLQRVRSLPFVFEKRQDGVPLWSILKAE